MKTRTADAVLMSEPGTGHGASYASGGVGVVIGASSGDGLAVAAPLPFVVPVVVLGDIGPLDLDVGQLVESAVQK